MSDLMYSLIDLFYAVGLMGVKGLFAATVVVLILFLLWRTRASKTVLLLLWAVVAFRLVCPWSPSSPLSLYNLYGVDDAIIGELDDFGDHSTYYSPTGRVHYEEEGTENFDRAVEAGGRPVTNEVTGKQSVTYTTDSDGDIIPLMSLTDQLGMVLAPVWLVGVVGLLIYSVASYLRLKRRLRFAVKDDTLPDVWYSDQISSPCVVGFFRPKIYLTFGMDDHEKEYVLAHERQHIQNRDHLWKVIAWLIMCVHWFNPLLWLFYRSFLIMVEDACDQRVLRQLGEEKKADYSQALLTLSAARRFRPGPSPIAFDEGDTKNRVKTILKYKKPILWVTVIAVVIAAVAGISLFTGPAEEDAPATEMDYTITDVVLQTALSSVTNNYFRERSEGAAVHLSASLFSIEGKGFVDDVTVTDPVYRAMELEDTLPNFIPTDENGQSEEPLFQIPLPEGARGLEVLTENGEEIGYHIFVMDEYIWLGKWVSHGSVGTISEYWYIIEAHPSHRVFSEEPDYGDDATPTATLDPVESAPAMPGESAISDWEDLVLTWTIPKSAEDPMEYGFPLAFSFPFDYFDASCAGGTPYAYGNIILLSGHPIKNAKGSFLYWWPYEEGGDRPAETASITAGVYLDEEEILACSLILHLTEETKDALTYSILATLHGHTDYVYLEDPETFGGMIRSADRGTPEVLTTWSADLTHDGVDERIDILSDYDGQVFYVNVRDANGRGLWSDSAAAYHAGQNGIYLYEEDGKHYLMNWRNYGQSGMGSIDYTVFSLTENGEPVVLYEDHFGMEFDDPLAVDLDAFLVFNEKSVQLLSNSMVLVSTNGDTPEREYYSTPERVLTPIIQESYLMWWSLENLEAIQAKAQGTYTFQGEVVNIFEDSILVEDQSLWATDGYPYYFRVSVDDRTQFAVGDKVRVTADGPLYRRDLPDEGTHVEVRRIESDT